MMGRDWVRVSEAKPRIERRAKVWSVHIEMENENENENEKNEKADRSVCGHSTAWHSHLARSKVAVGYIYIPVDPERIRKRAS